MRAVAIYLIIAVLTALAAYIIRANNRWISDILLVIAVACLCILGISIFIEQ